MKVEYQVELDQEKMTHVLVIKETPVKSVADGLAIQHGEVVPMDEQIGHQPVLTHDVYEGVTEYDLPPEFDPRTITEVHVNDQAFSEETLIHKPGSLT